MAASASVAGVPALPAERFFRTSLFLLMATAVTTLVSTGKLDLVTMIVAPSAVLYKGVRWWRRCPSEIPQRLATRLVVLYLVVFPVDVLFLSRSFVAASPNPALYAALLGAVHFLLFVMLIRLYSATTDRDALFLTMLSFAAILASGCGHAAKARTPTGPRAGLRRAQRSTRLNGYRRRAVFLFSALQRRVSGTHQLATVADVGLQR
jgi:hypothetical protein